MDGASQTVSSESQQMLRQDVMQRCPAVDPQLIDGFFTQLDADYFTLFTAAEIAAHVMLSAAVDDAHPVQVRITLQGMNRAEILVVAGDLFGEFSLITGFIAVYARSSVGGVIGWSVEIGGGSYCIIFPMTLAALFPSNAFFPVAIS